MSPEQHEGKTSAMITFEKVNKRFGTFQALTDVNAEVRRGEVVVVCGPSGSGKSTLIRTVNRLEEINSGAITFDGRNVHAPMSRRENMLRVAEGIEAMGQEEAAYWMGMAMHRVNPRRVLSALRMLLTDPARGSDVRR